MSIKRKRLLVAGGVLGVALGCAAWINRRLFTINDVTTGESAAYPELTSRVYHASAEESLLAAEKSVDRLPRWRVVHTDGGNSSIEAEVETLVGSFLDDVTITMVHLDEDRTRVVIRSRSRQGRGDLGQNAVHIRELQDEMDQRLTGNAAF